MSRKGFFGSLYDFSFSSFVFPKIISFLYAVVVILMSLGAVAMIIAGLAGGRQLQEQLGDLPGWTLLIIVPIAYILYLIVLRIWFEIAIVLFRIYENTDRIAGSGRGA